jgi:hypothetical protein
VTEVPSRHSVAELGLQIAGAETRPPVYAD